MSILISVICNVFTSLIVIYIIAYEITFNTYCLPVIHNMCNLLAWILSCLHQAGISDIICIICNLTCFNVK